MSIWKHYFDDNKELVDYLTELLNKNGGENIDIKKFSECDEDLNDQIYKKNKMTHSEINTSGYAIIHNNSDGNIYTGKYNTFTLKIIFLKRSEERDWIKLYRKFLRTTEKYNFCRDIVINKIRLIL